MSGHPFPARTLAVLTALLTFFQGALWPSTPEARFWAERRRTVEQRFGRESLQSVVPEVGQGLGQLEVEVAGSAFTATSLSRSAAGVVPAWCPPSLAMDGQIQEAARSLRPGPARGTVLHILDVHGAYEAQNHIAELLEKISRARGDNPPDNLLVGLEGATGGFLIDKAKYWALPETLPQAADQMLRANILSGPEVFGAKTNTYSTLWGVENHWAYLDNIKAYRRTHPYRAKDRRDLESLVQETDRLKSLLFPPLLKTLDTQGRRFNQHLGNLGEFVALLTRHADPQDINANLRRFTQALLQEKTLNFPQAARERARLLDALGEDLSSRESQHLMDWAGQYRAGQISPAEFHGELRRLTAVHGVKVGRLPEFEKYIRYLERAESVNKLALARDIRLLEKTVVLRECRTPAQRGLAEMTWDLEQVRKLINYGLTPDEWTLYQSRRGDMARIPQRLKALTPAHELKAPVDVFGRLQAYEDFYRAAEARNDALVTNLEKRWAKTTSRDPAGGRTAVLVAGGFHGPGLRDLLLRRGYNYVAISPKLSELKDIPDSLAGFDQDKAQVLSQYLSPARRTAMSSPEANAVLSALLVRSIALKYKGLGKSEESKTALKDNLDKAGVTVREVDGGVSISGLPGDPRQVWVAKVEEDGPVLVTPPPTLIQGTDQSSPRAVIRFFAALPTLASQVFSRALAYGGFSLMDRFGWMETNPWKRRSVLELMENLTNQLPLRFTQVFDVVARPNALPLVVDTLTTESTESPAITPSFTGIFNKENFPLPTLSNQALTAFGRMTHPILRLFPGMERRARQQFVRQTLLASMARSIALREPQERALENLLPLIAASVGLLKNLSPAQGEGLATLLWNAFLEGTTETPLNPSAPLIFQANGTDEAGKILDSSRTAGRLGSHSGEIYLVGLNDNAVVRLTSTGKKESLPKVSVKRFITSAGLLDAAALAQELLATTPSKVNAATFISATPDKLFIDPATDFLLTLRDQNFKLLLQITEAYIQFRKAIDTSA